MIKIGQRVPDAPLQELHGTDVRTVRSGQLFAGRTVVAFALPGAFTPTCSAQHLPRYVELADMLRRHGVDEIVCLSVNDPFVMQRWGEDQGARGVRLLADGNGEFSRSMGLLLDMAGKGMGQRSRRYSMLVRDGRIEELFVEADKPGDPYEVSDADTMLRAIAGESTPHLAILTKPGCPFCAQAKRMLDASRLPYTELPIPDAARGRVLQAVAGEATAPQVFADGERIGGTEALDSWLARRGAASARTEEQLAEETA